jgi:predicted RNA-binding protein with PUA domain
MKRRVLKIQRHDVKGARPIFWCGECEKFTYNLRTHLCGERQNWDVGL